MVIEGLRLTVAQDFSIFPAQKGEHHCTFAEMSKPLGYSISRALGYYKESQHYIKVVIVVIGLTNRKSKKLRRMDLCIKGFYI